MSKVKIVLVLLTTIVLMLGVTGSALAEGGEKGADIIIVSDNSIIRIYEDKDFCNRIIVVKSGGDIEATCPCAVNAEIAEIGDVGSLLYSDENDPFLQIYENGEFGRVAVNLMGDGAVDAYCPCCQPKVVVMGLPIPIVGDVILVSNPQPSLTPTPSPTVTTSPTPTPSPTVTTSPTPTTSPTATAQPTKVLCNNGVGDLNDCLTYGHDKDGDGIPDKWPGYNDNDLLTLNCGWPGMPCNRLLAQAKKVDEVDPDKKVAKVDEVDPDKKVAKVEKLDKVKDVKTNNSNKHLHTD